MTYDVGVSAGSATSAHKELVRRAARKAAWRLLPLLAAGYLISYIDRSNIGFAALTMNQALGLTAVQYGFAAGVFYVGYVLLEIPSNLALRRFGARRWLARIMITWGLAAAGTALATGPQSLYVMRLLTGAAEAGFYPGVIFYLCTWFPSEYRARAFAWFTVANPMSSVISGPLSAALLDMNGVWGLAGWQWLFICEGLPACLLGVVTLHFLPDAPADVKWLDEREKQALDSTLNAECHPAMTTDLWRAMRDPRTVILTISCFFLLVGVLGVTLWLPQMLKQHGLSTHAVGWMSAWPYFLACIGLLVWSTHLDRTRKFLSNYVAACLLAASGFALSVASSSLPITMAGISLALIGMNSARPAIYSILPTYLGGVAVAGSIALVNSVGNLGGFVGPYMIGWFRQTTGSFSLGMFALAVMLALAGLTAMLFPLVRAPDRLRSAARIRSP